MAEFEFEDYRDVREPRALRQYRFEAKPNPNITERELELIEYTLLLQRYLYDKTCIRHRD